MSQKYKPGKKSAFPERNKLVDPPNGDAPTHELTALSKSTGRRGQIGVAWLKENENGTYLSVQLNSCVVLTDNPDIVINVWPIDWNTFAKVAPKRAEEMSSRVSPELQQVKVGSDTNVARPAKVFTLEELAQMYHRYWMKHGFSTLKFDEWYDVLACSGIALERLWTNTELDQIEQVCNRLRKALENIPSAPTNKEVDNSGLHSVEGHPDYEYETTSGPRKAWDDENRPPEGEGWEKNVDKGNLGFERFDDCEQSYWRRKKRTEDPKPPADNQPPF